MPTPFIPLHQREFLSRSEVARLLGVHPKTITRWVASGYFPAPIEYGDRTKRWTRESILNFRRETGI